MPKLTILGSYGFLWVAVALILLLDKRHRDCGIALALGLISSVVIGNLILKNAVARPRPCWLVEGYDLLVNNPTDFSFPSGHTLAGFIAATILFNYNRKWGIAAYILAAVIGFSRLYLYVHFPTDVLAGVILGICIGSLASYIAFKKLLKKQ